MSRWIKALTCSLVLAAASVGLGGCVGADDDSDVDSALEAVQLGDGQLGDGERGVGADLGAASSDVGSDGGADDGSAYLLDIDGAAVEGVGFERPGANKTEPVPEPWNDPRSPRSSGDPDADAEAKHMNAI